MIGNARLHWGLLSDKGVVSTWDTPHLDAAAIAPLLSNPSDFTPLLSLSPNPPSPPPTLAPPLLLASVVPSQSALWQRQAPTRLVALDQIPLTGLYPTMGIDRALALVGAGHQYGFPVLVIDGGTALTFSGVDGDRHVVGGAILPGVQLQGRSLSQHTAALSEVDLEPSPLPNRWALTTPEAIRSGILYTVLAGIRDFVSHWRAEFPTSPVVLTGGDGATLYRYLQTYSPDCVMDTHWNPNLVFEGIWVVRSSTSS